LVMFPLKNVVKATKKKMNILMKINKVQDTQD
jgi:hypothetical protein